MANIAFNKVLNAALKQTQQHNAYWAKQTLLGYYYESKRVRRLL